MNAAFILWSMIAGAGLILAAVRVLVWAHDRGSRANLWLAVLATALAGIAAGLALALAAAPGGAAWASRGAYVALLIAIVALAGFLKHDTDSPDRGLRRWRLLTAGCVIGVVGAGWLVAAWTLAGTPPGPLPAGLPFLIFFAAMTGELGRKLSASARMTAEARQHREELAHVVRVVNLNELSGSIAHELNQPLAIILANAQAALRMLTHPSADLEEVRNILSDIVNEDRRAGHMIQRLRALLKRGEATLLPVSLNEIVPEVLQLVGPNLSARGVEVSCELCPELPVVRGDSIQLQQILLNLVLNAADAMSGNPAGQRLLHVSTSVEGTKVKLSVRDEGAGLPADIEEIFRPFYTTKAQGLGMGLAICRSIASAHGGRLHAEPQGKTGAAFHLELPGRAGTGAS